MLETEPTAPCRHRIVIQLTEETGNEQVETMKLDLSSLKSVREFADTFKAKNLPLHMLVNNAGTDILEIYLFIGFGCRDFSSVLRFALPCYFVSPTGIMGLPERQETEDGFEMQMGVNHFVCVLLV